MSKSKINHYFVEEKLFHFGINLCAGGSVSDFFDAIESRYPNSVKSIPGPGTIGLFVSLDEKNSYWMWLPKKANVGIIVHETWHLVKKCMSLKGIPIDDSTEEVVAYMSEWWVSEILNRVKSA